MQDGKPETACRLLLLSFVCMQARKANTFLPTGISFFFVREETLWGEGGYSFCCLCCSLHFTISLFLTLKPRAFIYSGTPPYGHLVNSVTFLLRPLFFGGPAKTSISVFCSCKETFVNTVTSLLRPIFLAPCGDRNNGVPLYIFF